MQEYQNGANDSTELYSEYKKRDNENADVTPKLTRKSFVESNDDEATKRLHSKNLL